MLKLLMLLTLLSLLGCRIGQESGTELARYTDSAGRQVQDQSATLELRGSQLVLMSPYVNETLGGCTIADALMRPMLLARPVNDGYQFYDNLAYAYPHDIPRGHISKINLVGSARIPLPFQSTGTTRQDLINFYKRATYLVCDRSNYNRGADGRYHTPMLFRFRHKAENGLAINSLPRRMGTYPYVIDPLSVSRDVYGRLIYPHAVRYDNQWSRCQYNQTYCDNVKYGFVHERDYNRFVNLDLPKSRTVRWSPHGTIVETTY